MAGLSCLLKLDFFSGMSGVFFRYEIELETTAWLAFLLSKSKQEHVMSGLLPLSENLLTP
jgi:hypothetical protein